MREDFLAQGDLNRFGGNGEFVLQERDQAGEEGGIHGECEELGSESAVVAMSLIMQDSCLI